MGGWRKIIGGGGSSAPASEILMVTPNGVPVSLAPKEDLTGLDIFLTDNVFFQTNKNGAFAASVLKSGLVPTWFFGDGSANVEAISVSHNYLNGNTKTVRIGSKDGWLALTSLNLYDCNIVGVLDLSKFIKLGSDVYINNNAGVTQIIYPTSTTIFNALYIHNSALLSGEQNLTTLQNLGGDIHLENCPKVTKILFPSNSNSCIIAADNNILMTELDVSGMTGLHQLIARGCSIMNTLHLPVSNTPFSQLKVNNCILSNFDFSKPVNLLNNNNMKLEVSGTFPTAALLNKFLVEVNTNALSGFATREIYAGGPTPDASSGGYNGTAALNDLVSKGITVYHN